MPMLLRMAKSRGSAVSSKTPVKTPNPHPDYVGFTHAKTQQF